MKIILTLLLAIGFIGCEKSAQPQITPNEKTPTQEEVPKTEEEAPDSEMPPQVKKKNSPVTITKFFDFACGYCRRGAQTMQQLQEKYGKDVNVEFRHFVVHPSVMEAHKAVECAGEQGKFEAFFYEYFENQFAQTSEKAFKSVGEKVGINEKKFQSCLKSDRTLATINGHRSMGELIGITGTPNFVINNEKKIPGAISKEQFEKIVDEYLNKG